jgi:hypothetical protein
VMNEIVTTTACRIKTYFLLPRKRVNGVESHPESNRRLLSVGESQWTAQPRTCSGLPNRSGIITSAFELYLACAEHPPDVPVRSGSAGGEDPAAGNADVDAWVLE